MPWDEAEAAKQADALISSSGAAPPQATPASPPPNLIDLGEEESPYEFALRCRAAPRDASRTDNICPAQRLTPPPFPL